MTVTMVAGDTRPTKLIYEENKVPVDITGYTFDLVISYDPTPTTVTAQILDGPAGLLAFPWASDDLQAGSVPFRILVTDLTGTRKTYLMGTLEILA